MTKERFCEIIRELEAAEALQRKVAAAIRQYNNLIHSNYIDPYGMIVSHDYYVVQCLLAEIMEDLNGDIDYFCDELDYGKKFNIGDVVDDHLGTPDISTPEKLYDFLVIQREYREKLKGDL